MTGGLSGGQALLAPFCGSCKFGTAGKDDVFVSQRALFGVTWHGHTPRDGLTHTPLSSSLLGTEVSAPAQPPGPGCHSAPRCQ